MSSGISDHIKFMGAHLLLPRVYNAHAQTTHNSSIFLETFVSLKSATEMKSASLSLKKINEEEPLAETTGYMLYSAIANVIYPQGRQAELSFLH